MGELLSRAVRASSTWGSRARFSPGPSACSCGCLPLEVSCQRLRLCHRRRALIVAALFALFVVRLRADQIITGTALTLFSIGATGTAYRAAFGSGGAALNIATSGPFTIPLLSEIPLIGSAFFVQSPITYLLYAVIPLVWWWLYRTHHGLALRALGEAPAAVDAAGINGTRLRVGVILVSGTLAGLAGGSLVLAQAGTFVENMSAGRGFIAIAIVVLGRWRPFGVAAAAFLFGAASALQFGFQAMGWHLPYQLFLCHPVRARPLLRSPAWPGAFVHRRP